MWDDIKIGQGSHGNSAIGIAGLGCATHISENRVSYWISDAYLGLGMVIMKDTEEGQLLLGLMDTSINHPNATTNFAVDFYVADLVLTHAKGSAIQRAIDAALRDAYQKGSDERAAKIRDVLGVRDY